ncbi:3-hydroxyacyl-CoA dehydrogenase [Adhaeribacter radiodurans]|uniref:3-hydroxyacyl-CoA dehydrogenase n=2 Tax=Adhaeribacter radiodurans TaxID=2745197 RepID=A0A7L7LG82_9BACT|nr:3-hydroxyacyl-CoA dehydrogenase [Adhaeribacter radiodurans]
MEIVVLASPETEPEFRQKFPSPPLLYQVVFSYEALLPLLDNADVVFDYFLADEPQQLRLYAHRTNLIVFCQAAKIQLAALASTLPTLNCVLLGFNGLPGFLNRPILEVSVLYPASIPKLQTVCAYLNTEYLLVGDRVGMVTPRVIAMIINEACYTLQENTAQIQDIEVSMKLGTNYPYGPFEWANRIGIRHVYKLLTALYADTKDERYKICPLLKTKYLRGEMF